MDEILIEEKKYVSSKRAAKMTGYAKDYIGQLCREGRVPARLIGRGWYVLETAIQDHRFSNLETESKKKEIISTWESPRYEASKEELLPSLNRLKDTKSFTPVDIGISAADDEKDDQEVSQHIQDSWKAWFDRFDHTKNTTESVIPVVSEIEEIKEGPDEEIIEEEKNVIVPIHMVSRPLYRPPPEEFLPRNIAISLPSEPVPRQRSNRRIINTIQMAGAILAVVIATVAVIGSGYFDEYILSNNQVRIIAGVALYNK